MKTIQLERMKDAKGFIAALDQSGGSTPKALAMYGVGEDAYANETEMFQMIHDMRTRIIKSPIFTKERILAAILFEKTMNSQIDGVYTADYLWDTKGILPILKVDQGLAELRDGVQLMKPITKLNELLTVAKERNIFGTKMRSVIKSANKTGIRAIVDQQFEYGKIISAAGFVPILEPEVDINITDKAEAETMLKHEIVKHLKDLDANMKIVFKVTIPSVDNFYEDLMSNPNIVRMVALSGGYSRADANTKLSQNRGLIASFSRALTEGLSIKQSDDEFNKMLDTTVQSIYDASII